MKKGFFFVFALCGFYVLSSCGGGGSDDSGFNGGGRVFISLEPSSIDVGDRSQVRVDIFDVNEDGVVVKVLFPDALSYVGGTAQLEVDGDETEITPDVDTAGNNDDRYLVFFFSEDDFDKDAEGTVRFELQANDSVNDGEISVDLDIDDPTVPNNSEFSVQSPKFQAEDSARIDVDK